MPKHAKDRTGKIYGGWTVIGFIPKEERGSDPNKLWLCECKCGFTMARSHKQFIDVKIGCRSCAMKEVNRNVRLRPFEATYNAAKTSIIKRISRKRLHAFTITYEEFLEICQTGCCHYCHVSLQWAEYSSRGISTAYQIDRKDNELGYITNNVVSCCKRCNYGKGSSYTYEEWHTMTECYRLGKLAPTRETKTNWGNWTK